MPTFLHDVYRRLLTAFGPQHWWPGESPFEVMVGAILVQNTAWKNVERALQNLRDANLLAPGPLHDLPQAELEELLRPAGYYRIKSARLRHLLDFLLQRYDGSLEAMFATDLATLRQELLSIHGVGPETADSILLYAAGRPTFVVDTYTKRVLARHGWIDFDADYNAVKDYFESQLEDDVALYNEFHALLVRVGHLHCRPTPRCAGCPLEALLPEGGMMEPF
jgi:endonuclease-3 related protein